VHRCWRIGRHATAAGHLVCRRHMPGGAPTHEEVIAAHNAAAGEGGSLMSLKCHFDGNGWLQGPIRITHLSSPNHGSGFGTGRGVVMHTEAGYEAGTVETFMNPAAQVSAFFSIAQDGSCHQYVPVGRGLTAWSQAEGNSAWRGIEDEDRTNPAIPLTAAQLTTFAQILEACSEYDGFPLQITDSVGGTGLICHGDGGAAWGGHYNCPGNVRKAQRPQIIALAKQIRAGGGNVPPPTPTPAPSGNWTETMISNLPTLQQGASDTAGRPFLVHRLQALAAVIGQINGLNPARSLHVTGSFDAATTGAVKAIQAHFGLSQDGIVGPETWGVLVAGSPA
jgi:hypothetical protein